MPIDAEFLSKLVCPETRRPLRLATADELARVNAAIAAGKVHSSGGEPISDPLEEALVPEGGTLLYPVREDVPVLLVEEAIPLSQA
ncbi:MAG: hypothetical protein KDB80_17435 [Planctomycetes bacterium]|nr:hypothetical protein [Planctomycetota bacterium]